MKILLADDQPDVLEALRLLVKAEGFSPTLARSPAAVLAAVEGGDFDVVLLDLNYTRDTTSGREGLSLLPKLRELDATLPVVVMTAWGSVEGAVEAMRKGARDYVQKPWDNARLLATLRSQVELGRALRRMRRLERENAALRGEVPPLVAGSRAMAPVMRLIERIGPSDANVLLTGEHGTGKEVVACYLHAISRRASGPFVPVNAGGLAEGVFESELFGHVKGAFTDAREDRIGCFELADAGTLFLDEIANMPLAQQAKLLRVLQTGELSPVGSSKVRKVNARVLSATNVDVGAEVHAGRFREDLLYRLNTVEIHLPPLRERREDIPALAGHFLVSHAKRYRIENASFDPSAIEALLAHPFPGNVRELEHAVERALLLAPSGLIRAEDIMLRRPSQAPNRLEEMTLEEAEGHLIARALARTGGNVSDAARALGLSRSALYRRMQHFGLKGSG
ncbi:sigma-54-dependent transcriptional regulator [Polyangium jinanense]|uniref:Sigma-54-dependent Fis family transcriptional regulator n=1 Tax=Polyangium jinanense TaxID=2829994 RepID=A0A9X4AZT3_9BACT|nr:sigma-54 dependent transcriptional regulator [Polyangium jinanense]MDC3988670.1 sigma-54-dependent Fis family transcriptional regulator [Polyangium jinanense]